MVESNNQTQYDEDTGEGIYPPGADKTPNARFAISVLSREKSAISYKGEVSAEKSIGQFLIKDLEGNLVSYDKISRQKAFERYVQADAKLKGLFGDVMRIELSDKVLPAVLQQGKNIIDIVTLTRTNTINKLSLAVDLDTVLLGSDSRLAHKPTIVEYKISVVSNRGEEEITLVGNSGDIITIDFDDYITKNIGALDPTDITGLTLKSIKFNVDQSYKTTNTRLILSDILTIVEEYE